MFGDDLAGVTEACEIFGMKKSDRVEAFTQIASMKAALSAVKNAQTVEEQHRAEKKVVGLPNTMKPAEYSSTRQAYEKSHGKTVDSRLPGVTIIETMEADLESAEFTTPQLNVMPSREEVLAASKGRSDAVGLSVTFSSTERSYSNPSKSNSRCLPPQRNSGTGYGFCLRQLNS